MIPPNVGEHDAELLRRAYGLTTEQERDRLYDDWAETYDQTMMDGLGYLSPIHLADEFAEHTPWRDRPVLDLGCGTGLVGKFLASHGFTAIDGLDLSDAMMGRAAARGVYGTFITADLTRPLPIADGTYAGAICSGTFTSGHVDASCLDEIARILAPGGIFGASVNHAVWEASGFSAGFARLVATGIFEEVSVKESTYYQSSTSTDGRHCVYRRVG